MHFVKKTSTSEENEEQRTAEEKKRAAKLKIFVEARDLVFRKRKDGIYDDDLLSLCAELLRKNPDIYTLWNIRREAIQRRTDKIAEESFEEYTERLIKLYNNELALTQECLFKNPKSYSAWNHRHFAYRHHPRPDLKRELALCEQALAEDCRNFHCWDHRRSIASLAELSASEELNFSDRLVGRNPSNYSAWHYRAMQLPLTMPNNDGHPEAVISDQCLADEMNKVLNVCGVNSEDQTGWTYCRWLVELAAAKNMGDRQDKVSLTYCLLGNDSALLVFSDAVSEAKVRYDFWISDAVAKSLHLQAFSPFNAPSQSAAWHCAHVWLVTGLPTEPLGQYSVANGCVNSVYLEKYYSPKPTCTREQPREALGSLVSMCEGLIEAEDNPWEVAALTRARVALDGITDQTAKIAEENREKLQRFDPQRAAMYAELGDKIRLVNALTKRPDQSSSSSDSKKEDNKSQLDLLKEWSSSRLVLRGIGLYSLVHLRPLSGLVQELDLSDNQLCANKLTQLCTFVALDHLTLDGNPIESLPPMKPYWFPRLSFLSLARTRICMASVFEPALALGVFPSLERLVLCETPLANSEEQRRALLELVERRAKEGKKRIRLILDWTR